MNDVRDDARNDSVVTCDDGVVCDVSGLTAVVRQAVDSGDDSGREGLWFDVNQALRFDESHGGGAGSQYDYQELYRTAKGAWVLHRWNVRDTMGSTWRLVSEDYAAAWVVRNGCDDSLPAEMFDAFEV